MSAPQPYYDVDGVTLYHGDCFDVMARMPTASVDAIVTDPPYLNTGTGSSRVSVAAAIPDERQFFDLWMREFWRVAARVLKPTGALWMTIDWRGAVSCERAAGGTDLDFSGVGVWDRGGLGMGFVLRHVYECFVVARKPRWQRTLTDERDVWRLDWFPSSRTTGHEAEKPTALIERALRLIAPPSGGVVLDPFAGSGSVGVAAVGAGYRYIGIEREHEWAVSATERIRNAASQGVLDLDLTRFNGHRVYAARARARCSSSYCTGLL